MSRLSDYGIVLLSHLAAGAGRERVLNARELAEAAALPLPVVSKILKALAREGVLDSRRGAKGGYTLSRRPEEVSVAEVIAALEGPLGLTECTANPGHCEQELSCQVRMPWQRINRTVRDALERVSLAELIPKRGASTIPADRVLTEGSGTGDSLVPRETG